MTRKALILGAGIAGLSTARSLASRGWQVTVIDKQKSFAQGASHSKAAIALPLFSAEPSPLGQLAWNGYQYLIQILQEHPEVVHSKTGLLHLAMSSTKLSKWERALRSLSLPASDAQILSSSDASRVAGVSIAYDALYLPQAPWVNLSSLCEMFLRKCEDRIDCIFDTVVADVRFQNQSWQAIDKNQHVIAEGDVLVLANGYEMLNLKIASWLPLRKVHGQIAHLEGSTHLRKLKAILCFDAYITPTLSDNTHVLGATDDSTDTMIEKLKTAVPEFRSENFKVDSTWTNFRTSVAGQEPIIGGMIDAAGTSLLGLYVLTALGSRGSLFGTYGAELLAHIIECERPHIDDTSMKNFSPKRFIRDIREHTHEKH